MECEVVIAGLGPVGQLLALLLGDLGVDTIAVEEADEPYALPRAAVLDDEVLRIFQAVGLDAAVLADAQVQPGVSYVTNRGRTIRVIDTQHGELGQPPLVSIHQPSLERTLLGALRERGDVRLRTGTRVERVEQDADTVTAWVTPAGDDRAAPEAITARYLVACDGGRSPVRTQLDIPFGGSTFVQRWLVVDALVDRPLARVPHTHFVGDITRPIVSLPMSPGRHRWEWMLHPGEDEAPFTDPRRIRTLIQPWLTGERVEVERGVVYTFHARTAARWREHKILLAGDAAHVMPPFVGQGFSSGARDAGNLAWKLDAVLHGAPDELLDSYEAERRPHVTKMQNLAVRWGGVVQTTSPRVGRARDGVIELLDRSGALRALTRRAKPLPTYGAGAFARRPHQIPLRRTVGALFPQPDRLDATLGAGWAVVASTQAAADAWRNRGLHLVAHAHHHEWSLLRPDRFVFACGTADEVAPAARALLATVGEGLRSGSRQRRSPR